MNAVTHHPTTCTGPNNPNKISRTQLGAVAPILEIGGMECPSPNATRGIFTMTGNIPRSPNAAQASQEAGAIRISFQDGSSFATVSLFDIADALRQQIGDVLSASPTMAGAVQFSSVYSKKIHVRRGFSPFHIKG